MEMFEATISGTDVFPTSTPAMIAELRNEVCVLESNLKSMTDNFQIQSKRADSLANSVQLYKNKIDDVRTHLMELYEQDGEISEDLQEIAHILGITLTKRIEGTAVLTISYTADVPMDFDPSDLSLSYTIDCDSYDAENFDFTEDDFEVNTAEGGW